MKKLYILFFTSLSILLSYSQGSETFNNFTETGASYSNGTFIGQDGSNWTYTQSRGDKSITGKSLMLGRNRDPQSELSSGTITGGIGTISFNYQQTFSTTVNLTVLINNITYATLTSTDNTVNNSGTITVNQPGDVVIKFISKNNSDGQVTIDDITWTGYTGSDNPSLSVTSPTNNTTYASGISTVDLKFSTTNTNSGDQVNITINNETTNLNTTSPFNINTTDGNSYAVLIELVDSNAIVLDSKTINFNISFPCLLTTETTTTTCDTETKNIDTYTTSIDFSGGGSSTYTIDTNGIGNITGDNPSSATSGTIIITGVNQGTDFSITITGDAANSSCLITKNITSPTCGSITCPNIGDIIISEIMQNPNSVSDANGEYFEVYNTTNATIDLFGWTITDNGSDSHTINQSITIPGNSYAVLGINNLFSTNGGITVNYEYSGISLTNGDDEIILSCGSTIIDQVYYDGGIHFPDPNGASMELSTKSMNATDNDTGTNWAEATTPYGNGDLGTPGSANNFTLSTLHNQITGFNMYPNPTNTGFIKITSKNNAKISINIFNTLGELVLQSTVTNSEIDLSNLKKGIYILKASQNNAITTRKLVIN